MPKNELKRVTIPYGSLKRAYMAIVDGNTKDVFTRASNRRRAAELKESWDGGRGDHYGGSTKDMLKYLREGYSVPGLAAQVQGATYDRPRRRLRIADEGEYQYDLDMAGWDDPYLAWDIRHAKPGMTVEICIDFHYGVKRPIVEAYETFAAKVLTALEREGYDLEIAVVSRSLGLLRRDGYRDNRYEVIVPVKGANEILDTRSWGAMFSPPAFRHLIFTALIMTADALRADVSSGLGSPGGNAWDVTWDGDRRTLRLESNGTGAVDFPEKEMQTKLDEALKGA